MIITEQKRKRINIYFKAFILLVILVGIPLYFYFFQRDFITQFTSVSDIENYLTEHKSTGVFTYIGAQIIQIIICVIPGQPFQFAAGYVFGPWQSLLFSIIGIALGATITFFLAKLLGRDFMYLCFGEMKVVEYLEKFSSKRGYILLFVLYFIPGFPKDFVNYIAGLSNLKWGPFIIISSIARIPAMMGSILLGTFTKTENYALVVVLVIAVIILTLLCLKNKQKILDWSDRVYDKLSHLKY